MQGLHSMADRLRASLMKVFKQSSAYSFLPQACNEMGDFRTFKECLDFWNTTDYFPSVFIESFQSDDRD
jgi:hypothetical protein